MDRQTDRQTDGQDQHMMGLPSRKDGPIIRRLRASEGLAVSQQCSRRVEVSSEWSDSCVDELLVCGDVGSRHLVNVITM